MGLGQCDVPRRADSHLDVETYTDVATNCTVDVEVTAIRKAAIAPCSWTPEESQVESSEHQDNTNIHCQPFPESVSEEHEIYTDYDGCHRHHVKHDS